MIFLWDILAVIGIFALLVVAALFGARWYFIWEDRKWERRNQKEIEDRYYL